jgi:hypothetical protein
MYKEMLVVQVNRVVDKKRIIRKRRAEMEERHKGLLTPSHKRGGAGLNATNCDRTYKLFCSITYCIQVHIYFRCMV